MVIRKKGKNTAPKLEEVLKADLVRTFPFIFEKNKKKVGYRSKDFGRRND